MYTDGGEPTLTDVTFSDNTASSGGGMYNEDSELTLNDVIFSGNTAMEDGGGMYNTTITVGNLTLNDVIFSGNTAIEDGGGMYNYSRFIMQIDYSSFPTLTDVTFSDNHAHSGGGVYNRGGDLSLVNVIFSDNRAYSGGGMTDNCLVYYSGEARPGTTLAGVNFIGNVAMKFGGGMYNVCRGMLPWNLFDSATLTDVTFRGNFARFGGGMSNSYSGPVLTNVTFINNSATARGGGMSNYDHSRPSLKNVTFIDNSADFYGGGMSNFESRPWLQNVIFSGNSVNYYGGGMYNYASRPSLSNVTFSGNAALENGGGMYNQYDSDDHYYNTPHLTNCILWGNAPDQIFDNDSTPDVTYSDVQDGYPGVGNIAADPLFVDVDGPDDLAGTPDDNLRLHVNSPAIDAGDNAAVPEYITTDRDGQPRFVDVPSVPDTGDGDPPIVDMGAYEHQVQATFLPLVSTGN